MARKRALVRLRPGDVPPAGPPRPGVLPRAYPRGDRHRRGPFGGPLVPAAPAHRLPDSKQVPRRDPPSLRRHALPGVYHEGRLFVRPGPGGAGALLRQDVPGLRTDFRAPRAQDPRCTGGRRRHRRRRQPRIHGDRRDGRGGDRLLHRVQLCRQRGAGRGETRASLAARDGSASSRSGGDSGRADHCGAGSVSFPACEPHDQDIDLPRRWKSCGGAGARRPGSERSEAQAGPGSARGGARRPRRPWRRSPEPRWGSQALWASKG